MGHETKYHQINSGSEQQGWSRNSNNYEPAMKESVFVSNSRLGIGIMTNQAASPFIQDKNTASIFEDENIIFRTNVENHQSFNMKSISQNSIINNKFLQPRDI